MSRSKWKTPYIDKGFLKRISSEKKKIITWSRRSTVYPAAIGLKIWIYNGKEMISRKIKPEMVGHKLGEFAPTRKTYVPKKKKIKNTLKKKKK